MSSISNLAHAEDTTTNLRCYYRVEPTSQTNSEVDYYWALDKDKNRTYRVTGTWKSSEPLLDMFYTNVSDERLRDRCEDTLRRKNIAAPLVMYAAADHFFSYNYLVWNVDDEDKGREEKINRIVAFGDSLSDTNNFFNGARWLTAPSKTNYYSGRFTNGKNWLDYLSDRFKLPVYNWAIAGAATVDYDIIKGKSGYWPEGGVPKINGIRSQVDSWIRYMDTSFMGDDDVNSNQFYNPKNTLFTLLVGGNDLLQYGTPVATMIFEEEQTLVNLIHHGAKNILLSTVPDVSTSPVLSLRKSDQNDPKTDRDKIHEQLIRFNDEVKKLAAKLQASYGDTINIQVFDAYAVVRAIVKNPEHYGVTNTTDSCLEVTSEATGTYYSETEMRLSCSSASNKADNFVYWDLIHPTTAMHKILADKTAEFIENKFPLALSE